MIALFDRASWPMIKRIASTYIRPYMGWIAMAVFWMVIAASMSAVFASLIQPVLDDILINNRHGRIVPLALAVLCCFAFRGISTYAHTVLMNKTGQSIVADIQNAVFAHLMRLDLAYFHANSSGTLLSRMTSDTNVMRTAVAEGLTNMGKHTLTLILLVGVMFWRDWTLALAVFIIFPATAIFVARLGKRLRKLSIRTQDSIGHMSALLTQVFQGIRQVKAYGREDFEIERMQTRVSEIRDLNIKNVKTGTLSTPVNDILVGLCVFGLIIYGGNQTAAGALTPGELMSFITAFLMSYEPMKRIAKLNNTIQIGLGAASRVFDVLDSNPDIPSNIPGEKPKFTTPDVVFDHVNFAYAGADDNALGDASFHARGGKVTALVGPSGGGKSTVLNILLRFYDPQGGKVLIDGHDVRALDLAHLRSSIALVSQDITIFDDTALNNIAYGRTGATESEIMAAARAAHAYDFIMRLPNGFKTELGENGVSLSGGQRQRIALARAFLKNAPILLLDEATSALDAESENLVQESLEKLQAGRTTLVIAHRLSTVQHADQILVIENGTVVEQGAHDTLINQGGQYAGLYAHNILAA